MKARSFFFSHQQIEPTMPEVRELIKAVRPDPWREFKGFSPDMDRVHKELSGAGDAQDRLADILAGWLRSSQPCFFGRIAVAKDLLSYCILTERHLVRSDEELREMIQAARLRWHQEGYAGRKSGFIIW